MKKFILILVIALVSTVGCSKKEKNKTSLRRADRGAGTGYGQMPGRDGSQSVSGREWVAVTRDQGGTGMSQDVFQESVEYLVSATVDIFDDVMPIGNVSGSDGSSTGIRLKSFMPTNTSIDPQGNNNSIRINNSGSIFEMVIWDSFAGREDSEGEVIPGYEFTLLNGSASGTVNGNQVNFQVSDQYGEFNVTGRFDSRVFYGKVEYDNYEYFDGVSPGASATLGYIKMDTCVLFRCR